MRICAENKTGLEAQTRSHGIAIYLVIRRLHAGDSSHDFRR